MTKRPTVRDYRALEERCKALEEGVQEIREKEEKIRELKRRITADSKIIKTLIEENDMLNVK